ncbi:MAG: hypothetical protein WBZ36_05705 [Candidatus Nitrosopolaris sp.]
MVSQKIADVRAVGRVCRYMSLEQSEEFHKATRLLIEGMRKQGSEVGDIKDIKNALK